MGDMEKKIFLFFLFIFFLFCALFAAQKIVDVDFWWHLKTGEWIWQHKAIPHADPFSYTFKGADWIDYEWLFQAIIYPIYQLGSFATLIIFKIVIVVTTFIILFLTCREVDKEKGLLSITILFLVLLVTYSRFMERPQIIYLLIFTLYLYLLALYREGKITTRQLILFLLPAHVLWVNVHGSFLLGIFLVGAYALGRFIPQALSHHRDLKPVFRDKKLRGLLFLCLLLVLASFLNPYTYRVFLIPIKTAGADETLRGIAEWTPVDIRSLGLIVINYTTWFRLLFLIGAISFLIRMDTLKKIENIVIFAFFSYMAFKHVRFSSDFAVAAAPIIVSNLAQFQWRIGRWKWIPLFPLLIVVAISVNEVRNLGRLGLFGFGVRRNYPETTVNFLKEQGVKGKIFNNYGYGGYIIWHLWPDIPVFIDGRTPTIYDADFFWLYIEAQRDKGIWKKVVDNYGIEIVLEDNNREGGYAPLFYWLDEDDDWRLVAFDDLTNLYMKKGSKFNGLIAQYGFRYLRPADISMNYAKERREDKKYLKALEKELNAACQRFPQGFYPFYYLGVYHQIYGTKEHLQEAEKALRRAVLNHPNIPNIVRGYYELGFTLMKLERYNESIEALKKAIALQPNLPADAYYYLGNSLFRIGDIDEAIKFLEKYKEKTGPETRGEAYTLLGKTYLQRHKFRKALSCLVRAEYLEKPTWDTLLNIGVAYFGLDNLEKAKEYFERAMQMNPDEMRVIYNLAITYEKLQILDRAEELFGRLATMKPKSPEENFWVEKAKNKIHK